MKKALLLLAAALGGCATAPVETAECRNDGLDAFTGRHVAAELGADIMKASGARTLRWGGPGMAMTMDYRADRVTISYDEHNKVTSARCG